MASSDIYLTKEPLGQNRPQNSSSRRQRRIKSFDETAQGNVSATHRRRSSNSGFRRLRHLMKKSEFNKKFWITVIGSLGLALLLLIAWDFFFRYSPEPDYSQDMLDAVLK
jgi:hypothetical protein